MGAEQRFGMYPRILRLAQKLRNPKYRHAYVGAQVRQFLARQIRELRGNESQAEFGKRIDKAQNVVSRLEDPSYGKATLSTLLDMAAKLDRALIVRFVDFNTFLKFTDDQSDKAAAPASYDEFEVSEFAWKESVKALGKKVRRDATTQAYASPQNIGDDLFTRSATQMFIEDDELEESVPLAEIVQRPNIAGQQEIRSKRFRVFGQMETLQ